MTAWPTNQGALSTRKLTFYRITIHLTSRMTLAQVVYLTTCKEWINCETFCIEKLWFQWSHEYSFVRNTGKFNWLHQLLTPEKLIHQNRKKFLYRRIPLWNTDAQQLYLTNDFSRHDIEDLNIILSTLTDMSLTNQARDQWLVPLTRKVSLNLKMNRSDFRNAIQKQHTILLSAIVLLSVIVNYKLQCLVPRRLKCNDLEKLLKIILVSFLTKASTDPLS